MGKQPMPQYFRPVVNYEREASMEQENCKHPIAYAPILKGIIKDEPTEKPNLEEDPEEYRDNFSQPLAYLPLPHGVIKEEPLSGDGHDEFNSEIQENLLAYSPTPKGVVKEEPTSDGDEDDGCKLVAYSPLPHGVVKTESESEDVLDEFYSNIEKPQQEGNETRLNHNGTLMDTAAADPIPKSVVKEEPTTSDGDDDDGCELVAYAPLPHGIVKAELETGDGQNEFHCDIRMTQQGGSETQSNRNETFVDLSAADNGGNDTEPLRPVKRKRSAKKITNSASGYLEGNQSSETKPSPRILQSQSKRSSRPTLMGGDNGETGRIENEETRDLRRNSKAKEKQQSVEHAGETSEISEHSSSKDAEDLSGDDLSADVEDVFPSHSSSGPSQSSKQKVVGKTKAAEVHKNLEEKEKPEFKCPNCGKYFKFKSYLQQHLARTCGVKAQLSCKECGHLFKHEVTLRRHLMTTHNVKKSQLATFGAGPTARLVFNFKCGKCGKTYKHKSALGIHMKNECEVDPAFYCTLCDYRTKRKGDLKSHLICVHSVDPSQFASFGDAAPAVRPEHFFKCGKCGRSYKHKSHLNRHVKYECDVDPVFSCDQCDYRATHKSNLKSHIINLHL